MVNKSLWLNSLSEQDLAKHIIVSALLKQRFNCITKYSFRKNNLRDRKRDWLSQEEYLILQVLTRIVWNLHFTWGYSGFQLASFLCQMFFFSFVGTYRLEWQRNPEDPCACNLMVFWLISMYFLSECLSVKWRYCLFLSHWEFTFPKLCVWENASLTI